MSRVSALASYLRFRSALPPRLSEFAILVTAAQWQQQFEWDTHAPIALKAGVPQLVVDALWAGITPLNLEPISRSSTISAPSSIANDASALRHTNAP
jgi:4-carboxymuconolactone decarboxylase